MILGAGLDPKIYLEDPQYRKLMNANFISFTPVWGIIPQNRFHNQAMNINMQVKMALQLAVRHGKRIYGHYLLGREGVPQWLSELANRVQKPDSVLLEYFIAKNVGAYRGIMTDWLVANECFSQVGLVPSIWTKLCGERSVIDKAFHTAHKSDPNATLWLSEYGIQNEKLWDRLYLEVIGMLDRGVPIHGIGAHLHTELYWRRRGFKISGIAAHLFPFHSIKGERLRKEIRRFKALGLKFHLSELTVWPGNNSKQREVVLGKIYNRYAQIGVDEGCDMISFWSPLDDSTDESLSWHWRGKKDYPGLWRRDNKQITVKTFTKELLETIS